MMAMPGDPVKRGASSSKQDSIELPRLEEISEFVF